MLYVSQFPIRFSYNAKEFNLQKLKAIENTLPFGGLQDVDVRCDAVRVVGYRLGVCFGVVQADWMRSLTAGLDEKGLLEGVAALRSAGNVGTAAADFICGPYKEYRRTGDGTYVIRRLQSDTFELGSTLLREGLNLLAGGLSMADNITNHGIGYSTETERVAEPASAVEGLQHGADRLVLGAQEVYNKAVVQPQEEYNKGAGMTAAAGLAWQGGMLAPGAVVSAGAAAAAVLATGVRNGLFPDEHEARVEQLKAPPQRNVAAKFENAKTCFRCVEAGKPGTFSWLGGAHHCRKCFRTVCAEHSRMENHERICLGCLSKQLQAQNH